MSGRVWKFGDNLDTDAMAPGQYMKCAIDELARHCLETVRPEFASSVRAGDVVVAGRNLGAGSSREQAPQALKALGVSALVAVSYAGLFYRNALNLGLAALVCAEAGSIPDGTMIVVDHQAGRIVLPEQGRTLACEPMPGFLLAMVQDGGLLPHLQKRLAAERAEKERQ
jgi:3-isopropylmalate/(R)-2-methylmalate dehydratase small subunit